MKYWKVEITIIVTLFLIASCGSSQANTVLSFPTIRPPKPTVTKTHPPTLVPANVADKIVFPTNLPGCIDPATVEIGTITEVVDGDTIVAMINGEAWKIRYIGMDTPEMDSPGTTAQQAKDANFSLTANRKALFFSDVENTDMYDRLLRYVFVGEVFINQDLVARGLAEEQEYPPNIACADLLRSSESEAKADQLGIWMIAEGDPSIGMPRITAVDKRAEFVVITNQGAATVDLNGWVLMSERGNQACALNGTLPAGVSVKIFAQTGSDGYSCGSKDPIWNNSEADPAALYNPIGELVDRWEDLR